MTIHVKWLFGGFVTLLGLTGLYFAANATDGGLYFAGLAVFVTCLLYVLLQIKLTYDQPAADRSKGDKIGSNQLG